MFILGAYKHNACQYELKRRSGELRSTTRTGGATSPLAVQAQDSDCSVSAL